jgi:O-antigen/teichoic acid export membrane protein
MDAPRVKGALALVVGAGGVAAALGYLWTIVAGRLLTPAEYAGFSAAAAIIYFAVTACLPLMQSVAYFVVRGDAALERRLLTITAIAGAAVVIAGAIAASLWLAVSLVTTAALNVRRGVQLGEQRFDAYAWNIAAEAVLRIVFIVAFLQAHRSASSAIASYAASTLIATLLPGRIRRGGAAVPGFARYLAPMLAYTAIFAAFQNLDVLVARHAFAAADAGRYGAASFLARGAGMLVMPFAAFALPRLAQAADAADLRRRFAAICLAYAALAALAVAILGGASAWIVRTLFGTPYAAAAPLLFPLGGAIALSGLVYLVCQLPASGNSFRFLAAYAAGLVLDAALIAVWHGSALQLARSVAAANALTLLLVLPFARRLPSPRTPAAACSG